MNQPDLFTLSLPGIPDDVWDLFCAEADKIRAYRKHYSARTIAEYIRHHKTIDAGGREFVLNNNWVPIMARHYMTSRNCAGFFETRERHAA